MFRNLDGSKGGSQIDDTSTTNAWSGQKIQETIDSALSGGGSGGGVQSGSQAELVALTGMTKGDQFYMIGEKQILESDSENLASLRRDSRTKSGCFLH